MPAEALVIALMTQMVRAGLLDADGIDDMASDLEASGDTEAARLCRAAFVEAHAPSESEWNAERARLRFHVVRSDGGNSQD